MLRSYGCNLQGSEVVKEIIDANPLPLGPVTRAHPQIKDVFLSRCLNGTQRPSFGTGSASSRILHHPGIEFVYPAKE